MNSPTPSVVVFFAPWCPHCHEFVPSVSAASDTSSFPMTFVNAEALPAEAFKGSDPVFDLRYFPSMAVAQGGSMVAVDASADDIDGAVNRAMSQVGTEEIIRESSGSLDPLDNLFPR